MTHSPRSDDFSRAADLAATEVATVAARTGASPDALREQVRAVRALLFTVHKLALRDLTQRLEAAGLGISPPQYHVLRLLDQESATISELSGRMLLAPPTLVGIIDALERKGLVERGQDPLDRRRTPLLLTPSGAEMVAAFPQIMDDDALIRGLVAMGEAPAEQLRAHLCALVKQLEPGADLTPQTPLS